VTVNGITDAPGHSRPVARWQTMIALFDAQLKR